jgi:galactose mutarotase-like enzyme
MKPLALSAPLLAFLCFNASSVFAAARYSVSDSKTPENVALIVLRDETSRVEAAVAPTEGGELSSLRVEFKGRWVEMLYRGRSYAQAPGFRGKASVLWPALGSGIPKDAKPVNGKIESEYDFNGRRYPMPQHGFARTKPWRVVRSWANDTEAAVEVELVDDPSTRAQYPFGFALRITYRLSEGCVELRHTVTSSAANTAPMFFSIGNHIALAVPLLPESPAAAFKIESPARFEYLRGADGTPDGTTRERSFSPAIPLSSVKVFPAMSVGGFDGDPWFRATDASGIGVKVSHRAESQPNAPFIQFNLYGGTTEGFFCPEPFLGVQNSFNKRTGLVEIAPGKKWHWTIRVETEQD